MHYKITTDNQGTRLDKFLTENLPDLTRSQIKKKIKSGYVLVNNEVPTVHRFLKNGDEIEILEEKQIEVDDFTAPEVITETEDYLILEKPAGLIMHPSDNTRAKTLTDWLVEEYPDLQDVYDHQSPVGHIRPGIVHRLDKEVSGLVLVAKTQSAFDYFKQQFKERKVTKKYQGLVYGQIEKEEITISTPLEMRGGKSIARTDDMNEEDTPMSAFKDAEAEFQLEGVGKEEVNLREALTIVHPLKQYFNYTLLDVEIKTGRTHQIRTHLKSIGHQLVGDILYQTKIKNQNEIKRRKEDRQKLNRVFLHAYYLSFQDMSGEQVDFQADIPFKLKDFLKDIK